MEWYLCRFFPLCSQLFLRVLRFVKFFRFHDWRFQKNLSVLAWVLGGAKKVSWVCLRVSGSLEINDSKTVIRKWHEMNPKSSRSFRGFETVYTLYPPWLLPHWLTHLGSCISMFACDILLIDAVCFDLSSEHRTATCPAHLQCQETRLSDEVHKISQDSNSSGSHISPKSRFGDTLSWMTFQNGLHRWQHRDGRSRTSRASRIQTHDHMESWESTKAVRPSFPKKIWLMQGRQCRNRLRWNVGRVVACVENEAGLWIEIVQMILKCT